ncbi:MAG: DUF6049 family protein [Acidimicrobiales bacterium]
MPRRGAALGALLAIALTVVTTVAAPAHVQAQLPDPGDEPAVALVSQTPVAAPGEPFVISVRLAGIPADGSIALSVHQRVRSRSELALSMEGQQLRSVLFGPLVVPLSALPPQADGTLRVVLPIDQPGGLPLPTEGVYPLQLDAQDASGTPRATLVSHLIVPPAPGDPAPNLGVTMVAELAAPLALQPDGSTDLARGDVDALGALVEGLAGAPTVPASLAVRPETVEALLGSGEARDRELVEEMRSVASGRTVLDEPYVPLDLDSLARAQLIGELDPQLERGRAVLADALGVEPDGSVRLADPTLGADGLRTLAFAGATRLVVDDDHLEPLPAGTISYSVAQPFVLAVPEGADAEDDTPGDVLALAPDPVVRDLLEADDDPGLVVSRVLAELALLRLEQPSVARVSVLRLAPGLARATVEQLLEAIASGRPFEAMDLPDAFDHAEPVLDGGGSPADRALKPAPSHAIPAGTARAVRIRRSELDTFTTFVGSDSALPDLPSRHLLVATAAGLPDAERRAHIEAAHAAMAATASKVTTPPTFTLTLTAREGSIPLTIRNGSGVPVHVRVKLNSQKLEFPDGDTIDLALEEPTTRIDIPVRARATGAFPLLIDVRTPDGRRSLSTSRYTVRSTAVSGVGLLLSVGAGAFLIVWWARHWRRTRRSRKLVAANAHPAAQEPAAG